ncbi:MAG: hypothetical protein WDA27_06060 [Actinomycetota bacterium]
MNRARTTTAVVITALLTAVTSPAGATHNADAAYRATSDARRLAASAHASRPSAALASALRAADVRTSSLPRLVGLRPAGSPAGLAGALGVLSGALTSADALRTQALAPLSSADLVLLSNAIPLSPQSDARVRIRVNARDLAIPTNAVARALASRARAAAARINTAPLATAAIVVLRAVEDQAGALRRAAGGGISATVSHCGVAGDVAYESGDCSILVGDTGPNTYPAGITATLIVDLGGDDVYEGETAVARGTARAVVDVSGNDRYAHSVTSDVTGLTQQVDAAQGVGILGVGVLADLGGDDVYVASGTATTPEPGPAAAPRTLIAQGAGSVGAGVLADFGGEDTYTTALASTGGNVQAIAQGGGVAGLGALLDLEPSPATPSDAFDVSATSTLHKRTETDQFAQYVIGASSVTAQGGGTGGVGVMVDSAGNDTYKAIASGAVASTTAQGAALIGAGVLVDGGGNDTMTARALGNTTLGLTTSDPNVCWTVVVEVYAGSTIATGQGGAGLGAGILIDAGGNDTRALSAESTAGAIAEVASNYECPNTAEASSTSNGAIAIGQGAGGVGAGTLADLGGNDRNDVVATSLATARAIATSPGTNHELTEATVGEAGTEAQGYAFTGLGVLADAGGNDVYESRTSAESSETTSEGTTTTPGTASQHVQGWGATGAGWLVDLDGTDAYTTDPTGATAGADDSCWSNGPDGRGRDLRPGPALPVNCP